VPPSGGVVNVSEGIGNPVYDEDRPLEGFSMSDVDTNMFVTDDSFTVPSEKGGAGGTSMANPLYQDPYYGED
ncbi:MAM and LDL-receptor class A domain-containing 2-like, partial [Paramuricea clavata]